MKRIAIYPGSFDPITNGHIDVAKRALTMFDHLIIAVARNDAKHPMFTEEKRCELVSEAMSDFPERDRFQVESFDGLLMEYAESKEACAVIRGLRAVSDFEFEFQLALMNRKLNPKVETLFLMPSEAYTYLSSRIIKEVARLGGDISPFVPPCVESSLKQEFTP